MYLGTTQYLLMTLVNDFPKRNQAVYGLASHKKLKLVVAISTVISVSGCASTKTVVNCAWGAVGGAVGGAVVGLIAGQGDPTYALVGAGVGAMVGCGIGIYLDKREEQIAADATAAGFEPEFERIAITAESSASFSADAEDDVVASQVSLSTDTPLFASGKARISDPAKRKKLDQFLSGYISTLDKNSRVYIVGHTDADGSATYNQKLSEDRALYVAQRMLDLGLAKNRLFIEGVGESQPIARNDTEIGKAKNRRFDLIDVFNDGLANVVPVEQVLQVAKAKKQRIENIINAQPVAKDSVIKAQKTLKKKSQAVAKITKKRQAKDTNPLKLHGVPIEQFNMDIVATLGVPEEQGFSLISSAVASPVVGSCAFSEPVVKSTVYYLGDDNPSINMPVSDAVPSLYGTSWYGKAGTTMVTLDNVAIASGSLEATKQPILRFYTDYKGMNDKVDFEYPMHVETYKGNDSVLVRMYPKEKNANVHCSDVIFSTKGGATTKGVGMIYHSDGSTFGKSMQLSII